MSAPSGRQPACGFCDGTGLWADQDASAGPADPCPLCDGAGTAASIVVAAAVPPPVDVPVTVAQIVDLLSQLTQPERQEIYEVLHARYDCRIYR